MTDVYLKVREGQRFDLLERGLQSAIERNSSHTSVTTVHAPCGCECERLSVIIAFIFYLAKFYYGGINL
jgi:hypothetical protein